MQGDLAERGKNQVDSTSAIVLVVANFYVSS